MLRLLHGLCLRTLILGLVHWELERELGLLRNLRFLLIDVRRLSLLGLGIDLLLGRLVLLRALVSMLQLILHLTHLVLLLLIRIIRLLFTVLLGIGIGLRRALLLLYLLLKQHLLTHVHLALLLLVWIVGRPRVV